MGRKKIDIDWGIVNNMLENFCEGTEVAAALGISFDTLDRRIKDKFSVDFAYYKAQKRAVGKSGLRQLQLKSAKEGNVTMQIWLGKNYLEQSDKQEIDHTVNIPTLPDIIIK